MRLLFTLFIFFSVTGTFAQKNIDFSAKNFPEKTYELEKIKSSIKKGNILFNQQNYRAAIEYYKEAYKFNPDNAEISHKLGFCCLELKIDSFGLNYLKNAQNLYDDTPKLLKFDLARSYHLNCKFNEAIALYTELYKETEDQIFAKYISECEAGKELIENPINDIEIKNLGNSINSEFNEYSAYILFDNNLYFTSSRSEIDFRGKDDDIFYSVKTDTAWLKAENIQKPINTLGNDAIIGADNQQKIIYLYSDENNGDIFYSTFNDTVWSEPLRFYREIISENIETEPVFSKDGKKLYFLSNRKGTLGEKDIFFSEKDETGSWTTPLNLGHNINTIYDEQSLFLLGDTLFFASKGHNTMGGYDIFYTIKEKNGKFSNPVNIGYPINTPSDDLFFFVNQNNSLLSSSRLGTYGQSDIFSIEGVQIMITTQTDTTSNTEEELNPILKPAVSLVFVQNISFEINKYENPDAYPTLDKIADFLIENPEARISIFGYTDSQGREEYNKQLSEKRAEFVKGYLLSKGVSKESFTIEGKGEANQISMNKDENENYIWESLQYNRRVEFVVTKQGENSQLVVVQVDVPEKYKLKKEDNSNNFYSIWINSYNKPVGLDFFSDDKIFEKECEDGTYDYYYGKFGKYSDANDIIKNLKSEYPNAFIVLIEE